MKINFKTIFVVGLLAISSIFFAGCNISNIFNNTKEHTVTFNLMYDTNNIKVNIEDEDFAKEQQVIREGYVFLGWYNDNSYNTLFDFTTPIKTNITLYAKWEVPSNNNYFNFNFIASSNSYSISWNSENGIPENKQLIMPSSYYDLPVTQINSYGFENITGLENIIIPYTVTLIGSYAFSNANISNNIIIPSSVRSIGQKAFYRTEGPTSIIIPLNVTNIGQEAFSGSSISVIYAETTTAPTGWDGVNATYWGVRQSDIKVYENKFQYLIIDNEITITSQINGVENIEIPEEINNMPVTTIGARAFAYAKKLTSIYIPSSIQYIESSSFLDTYILTIYTEAQSKPEDWYLGSNFYNSNRPIYWGVELNDIKIYNNAFQYLIINGEIIITGQVYNIVDIIIPEAIEGIPVTTIGTKAFSCSETLESVTILPGVTSIESGAFYFTEKLNNVELPQSLINIYTHAFVWINNLNSIIIPQSVQYIESGTFYNASSLTIYAEATEMPDGWASDWNDSSLTPRIPVVWGYVKEEQ